MKASTAWNQTGYKYHRTNERIMEIVKESARFGFPYAVFMEHEISGPQRDWLRQEGYKIKRSRKPNKIEISWEG